MGAKKMQDSLRPLSNRSTMRRAPAAYGRDLDRYRGNKFQLRKVLAREEILRRQNAALIQRNNDLGKLFAGSKDAANCVAHLTLRERQVMEMVLAGHPSKNIAADLGISQRTVENHRAQIMKKTGSESISGLARIVLAAFCNDALGANT